MANWYCHILYLLNGFQVIIFPWSQFFVSWKTWRCRSVVSHTIRLRTILNSDFLPKFGHSVRWQELVEGLVFLSSFWRRLLSHNPVVIIVFIREGKHVVVNEFSPHLFPIRCKKPSCGVVLSLHRWEPSLIPQKQMSVLSTITTMYVHVKLLKPKFVIRVYHLAQSNWIFSLHKYYWSVIYNSNK